MKIEQRIGRVHRMGQTRDVLVTNYTLQDTFEDQLLDVLQRKLGLFRLVVGEVDMILGRLKVERRLAMLLLESRNETDLGDSMVRFGNELAAMRTQYQRTKEVNRSMLPAVAPMK